MFTSSSPVYIEKYDGNNNIVQIIASCKGQGRFVEWGNFALTTNNISQEITSTVGVSSSFPHEPVKSISLSYPSQVYMNLAFIVM